MIYDFLKYGFSNKASNFLREYCKILKIFKNSYKVYSVN